MFQQLEGLSIHSEGLRKLTGIRNQYRPFIRLPVVHKCANQRIKSMQARGELWWLHEDDRSTDMVPLAGCNAIPRAFHWVHNFRWTY